MISKIKYFLYSVIEKENHTFLQEIICPFENSKDILRKIIQNIDYFIFFQDDSPNDISENAGFFTEVEIYFTDKFLPTINKTTFNPHKQARYAI